MERSLDIEVTRRCNLRCDYCFVGWSRDWTSDLPLEVARQVIREGAGRFDVLHLTGGEPFAYRAIFELIELGLAEGYPSILINSNGTMLSEAHIARLGSYGGRVALSISLDGPAPLHDRVRGPGRFAQSDQVIAALIAAGVPVTLMTVVTPQVLDVLPAFLRERMGAHPGLRGITLFPVGVGHHGSQKPGAALASLTPAMLQHLAACVALAWHAGFPVTVGAYPMINPLLLALGYPAEHLYQCTAGRGRVCIHADEGVSSCHPVKEPIYGRWRSGLLEQLAAAPIHRALAERDFDGCRDCSHREACGHCRAFVTAGGAPLLGNDQVCLEAVPGRREEFATQGDTPGPLAGLHAERPAAPGLVRADTLVRPRTGRGNVALVERLCGTLDTGDEAELARILADDVEDRNPMPAQPPGRVGVVYKLAFHRAAHPTARTTLTGIESTTQGAVARWHTAFESGRFAYEGRFTIAHGRITAMEVSRVG